MMRWGLLRGLGTTGAIALVSLCSLFGASASASDPLLSGYGGPGGGEQVVIGTKVLPPANGDGGLAQVSASGAPVKTTSGEQSTKRKPEKKKQQDSPDSSDQTAATGYKPVVYPAEASTASGLPLAQGDLLVLLIGAGVVGLIAFYFRRNGSAEQ